MARTRNIKNSLITLNPSFFLHLLSVSPFRLLILSPEAKRSPRNHHRLCSTPNLSLSFLSLLIFFTLIGLLTLSFVPISRNPVPCSAISPSPFNSFSSSPSQSPLLLASLSALVSDGTQDEPTLLKSSMVPLPAHGVARNASEEEKEFWQQPDSEDYRPCLDFSIAYRRKSKRISKEKKRFLMVVVSGGLNQQRNQIVDAVVIARILEAALVVPVLQVNHIWRDESEFSDIFDVEHFKKTLQADVRVVSSLPSTHLVSRQTVETQIPYHVPPIWFRSRFFKQLNEEGLLVLKGLDSKLSKNLPPDLQKLRCKVAFHALRFVAPIRELGNRLARRMWIEGPYIAVHLRLEKDVWLRTGCPTGLGAEFDNIIRRERESSPEFLTGKLNLNYTQRRLAGLCPLNTLELASLLRALGAPRTARIYIAGGEPFGGTQALQPLMEEFPNLVRKDKLAQEGELEPYLKRSSVLAAIDYMVSLSSDVFLPSHGGNMARAMQGHRAYVGHRKFIRPNKRMMLPLFEEAAAGNNDDDDNGEFRRMVKKLHSKSQGQPELRANRRDRDVVAYPVPECMCSVSNKHLINTHFVMNSIY